MSPIYTFIIIWLLLLWLISLWESPVVQLQGLLAFLSLLLCSFSSHKGAWEGKIISARKCHYGFRTQMPAGSFCVYTPVSWGVGKCSLDLGCSKLVQGPASSSSYGSWLEMHTLKLHLDLLNHKLHFNQIPRWLICTIKLEGPLDWSLLGPLRDTTQCWISRYLPQLHT